MGSCLVLASPRPPLASGPWTCLPFSVACSKSNSLSEPQPGADGLVFVNTRGNPPHTSSFASQTWLKARRAIWRPDLRWHDLRHTAVALAIAQGAHPKAIQERMGHASITVTLDRYGHLFPALGRQVADGLDQVYRESMTAPPAPSPIARPATRASSGPDGPPRRLRDLPPTALGGV